MVTGSNPERGVPAWLPPPSSSSQPPSHHGTDPSGPSHTRRETSDMNIYTGTTAVLRDPGLNPVPERVSEVVPELFSLVLGLRHSSGHPGGDVSQPPSHSGGLRLSISVPPVEGSGRQRFPVEGEMPTGGVSPARRLQNALRLEALLHLEQEEEKSDQESESG